METGDIATGLSASKTDGWCRCSGLEAWYFWIRPRRKWTMYFVDVRSGYTCGWFQRSGSTLVMQPHTLSRCLQESWKIPEDAEIIGRVVGVVMRLNEPWQFRFAESREERASSNKRVL